MIEQYKLDTQRLYLEMFLNDAETFSRCQSIFEPDNFDQKLRETAKFIKEHADEHKVLPTIDQIRAVTGVDLKPVPDLTEMHYEWFMTEFENFTKKQELERALRELARLNPHAKNVGGIWKNPLNPRSRGRRWDSSQLELFRKFQKEYATNEAQN